MAHADYSCCANCDSKMAYGEDGTKEDFCSSCAVQVYKITGVEGVPAFIEWLKTAHFDDISKLDINRCHYSNAVDDVLTERGFWRDD